LSDNTTPTTPDPVEALRAEATARLAALDAKGAPAKGASEAEKVVPVAEETAVKASDAEGGKTPEVAPKAVDVEWLPENLRSKASTLDPELIAYLKPGHMRRGEHSRAMKAMEEERKSIEAIKAKAGLWERLEANPEVAAKTYAMLNGEAPSAAAPESEEEVPDPLVDPKGYAKWMRESIVRELKTTTEKVIDERVFAPKNEEEAVRAAALSWAEDNHIDAATLKSVATRADAMAKRLGVRISAESVGELLATAYEASGKVAPTNGAANGAENGGLLKVVSPSSRGSTAVSPVGVPQHVREGRTPSTNEERVAHAAYLARERLGMKVSTEDISAMFSQRGVPAR